MIRGIVWIGSLARSVSLCLVALLVLLGVASASYPLAAQRPAELTGRVTTPAGDVVASASVELIEAGIRTLTDASGMYRFRAISGGRFTLRVTRVGFSDRSLTVDVEAGDTRVVDVEIVPNPVVVDAVGVTVASASPGSVRVLRDEIERTGARSVADVVRGLPGVVVSTATAGGASTLSVRGSAPDAVLVLVDGVVLNDPLTGEADLSIVSAESIESVTLLPGAQSARYGPRAEAGVLLIETRQASATRMVRGSLGSLGARSVAGSWGGDIGARGAAPNSSLSWAAGGEWSELKGAYDFVLPPEVGGGSGTRSNADARTASGWASGAASTLGGVARIRASVESLERGLPGRGYAPSPFARQSVDRLQGTAGWERRGERSAFDFVVAGARHDVRFLDPDPPFGLPYDDDARVTSVDLRTSAERIASTRAGGFDASSTSTAGIGYGGGLEARGQRMDATSLDGSAPPERFDVGAFAHASYGRVLGDARVGLTGQLRLDRSARGGGATADAAALARNLAEDARSIADATAGMATTRSNLASLSAATAPDEASDWFVTRALTLSASAMNGAEVHLSLRNSYSPPTLADQYFRSGVGVEPNPDLAAERVPLEIAADVRWMHAFARARGLLSMSAYRSDVRGMIVWQPDFRFIWSPRNVDVKRSGIESRASVESPSGWWSLSVAHAYTRVVYDRAAPDDDVQVIYRPRQSGAVELGMTRRGWRADLKAHFTGVRYPVAAAVNALPAFWNTSASLARDFRVGGWSLTTALRADRLFDEKDALIFGFPEPGRTLRLDLSLRPAGAHVPAFTRASTGP
jgi:vitamin B12 transporter